MDLIAEWLRARGVFPRDTENPTEAQVPDSLETPATSTAGELSASGNENSTGELTTTGADRDAQKDHTDQNATGLPQL